MLKKPVATTAQDMAVTKLAQQVKQVAERNVTSIDEMRFAKMRQSEYITLTVINKDITKRAMLVFGTPLGDSQDYMKVPLDITASPNDFNFLDFASDKLTDNMGDGMNFLKLLNRRFLRHAVIATRIEVVTNDDSYGQQQRQQQATLITVPLNSASDSQKLGGQYIPQYTEYTASQVISTPKILGDFTGVVYPILPAQAVDTHNRVQFNIYLGGVDVPNFANIK